MISFIGHDCWQIRRGRKASFMGKRTKIASRESRLRDLL
jgi:hypothetical protein